MLISQPFIVSPYLLYNAVLACTVRAFRFMILNAPSGK